MRGEVGAARAERAARAGEDQLRADAVGRGREQPPLVERMQAREAAEPGRAGRLDRRAQPLDDRAGDLERDSGARVAVRLGVQKVESTPGGGRLRPPPRRSGGDEGAEPALERTQPAHALREGGCVMNSDAMPPLGSGLTA